jgi:C-terminal processing protease CtpA/Prc
LIALFKHNANIYGQYYGSEHKELENIRAYIEKLAEMHTANLKMDTMQQFNQQITKHFEENDVSMSSLYQKLCMVREAAVSEFERKAKGKCAYTAI